MIRVLILLCLALSVWAAPASGEETFRSVTGPCSLSFPRDHGSHEGYRTEWWYYTGNLETFSKRRYGFQLTFFRVEMVPPGDETIWPRHPSAWRTRNLFFAHAALSDIQGRRFFHAERIARGAAGLAGVDLDNQSVRVFVDGWSAVLNESSHELDARAGAFALDFSCRPVKPPVAHGLGGYSRKGKDPASASCYYSFTRLDTGGTITVGGNTEKVHGLAWMDHEFSSAPLERDLTGWDWFSIQLDDRTELMLYLLRLESGGYSPASSGTFIKDTGEALHLRHEDFLVDVLDRWKSPDSGALYPAKWIIRVPRLHLELSVTPNLSDQELVTKRSTQVTYWEGSVFISGRSGEMPVSGAGYVELTGYAHPFNLTPTP